MSVLEKFLRSPIVRLEDFCGFPVTEKSGDVAALKTGTLPISIEKWRARLPGNKATYDPAEAGLYCFWWMGEYEQINTAFKTHFLKGKKIGKDDLRLHDDFHHLSKEGFIMHRLTWAFNRNVSEYGVPLYVGKSSSVSKRIRFHLQWPRSAWPRYTSPAQVGEIKRAGTVNTQTQFRKPFEYLFQEVTDDAERTRLLLSNVGVSFLSTPFHDVATRFFGEDELIGNLRPPFNLDTER